MDNPTIIKINGVEVKHGDILVLLKTEGKYKDALQEYLKTTAIKIYAQANKIEVTDDELQQYVNAKRKELNILTVDSTNTYLASLGINIDQWVDSLENEVLVDKVKNTVIPDDRVSNYFTENSLKYTELAVYKIAVGAQDMAEEILLEARDDGDDFTKLAAKYSTDEDTAPLGGYMGRIKRGELSTSLETRLFTADEGAITGPVADKDQFAIYKIGKIFHPILDDKLKKEIRDTLFDMWKSTLLQSCKLEAPSAPAPQAN